MKKYLFILSFIMLLTVCSCKGEKQNAGESGILQQSSSITQSVLYAENTESSGVTASEGGEDEKDAVNSEREGEKNESSAVSTASKKSDKVSSRLSSQASGTNSAGKLNSNKETSSKKASSSITSTSSKKASGSSTSASSGNVSSAECTHKNTEIRNQKDATTEGAGYTGDTYCIDCGIKTATGTEIPKLDINDGKVEHILPDGTHVWLEDVDDVTGYYMALKTYRVNHLYLEVEKEILRLCNEERAKVGVQPLEWFEDAYCFTQIRVNEAAIKWSHTRPNGKPYYTVYNDAGVYMHGHYGENLFETINEPIEKFAKNAVESLMNSPGHRANILDASYTRIAIAIVQNGGQLTMAQNFFS